MAYSPQNPPLPWPLIAFLADAISGECSDKQAQPTSSATLNRSAAWPPGHSWPHLARSYLQENGVGITVVIPTQSMGPWKTPHVNSSKHRGASAGCSSEPTASAVGQADDSADDLNGEEERSEVKTGAAKLDLLPIEPSPDGDERRKLGAQGPVRNDLMKAG